MDPLNVNFFSNTEKKFADSFKFVFNQEMFLVGVQLGASGEIFALTPAHAKRLVAHLTHVIADYESTHGKITGGEWSPNIPSPIQFGSDESRGGKK